MGALADQVRSSIDAVGLDERDKAVAQLALTYASEIEDGAMLEKVGPALLAALEALNLSPRSRKAVNVDKPAASALDQLAGARARKSRATDLDATAS